MIKMGILAILLLVDFNQKSQNQDTYQYKLTPLCEKVLDMFISDPMNDNRIDPLHCAIILSSGDIQNSNIELWISDGELIDSCIGSIYLTKYKGFNILYNGNEMKPKYFFVIGKNNKCKVCDSLLKTRPVDRRVPINQYDGSIYKIKKGTTLKNMIIEKVPGG